MTCFDAGGRLDRITGFSGLTGKKTGQDFQD